MGNRLRITIDFNPKKVEELTMYQYLMQFSSPGGTIKDILKGIAPIPEELKIKKEDKGE